MSCFVIFVIIAAALLTISFVEPIFAQKKEEKDKLIFKVKIFLQDLERIGFLRITALINGQEVVNDIPFSEIDPSKNTVKVDLKVDKKTDIIKASANDEYHVCVYHVKDLEKEYDFITKFDCNEGDVQSVNSPSTVSLFKPSSQVFSKSTGFQDKTLPIEEQEKANYEFTTDAYENEAETNSSTNNNNENNSDKAILKIYAPLGDRKDTKKLKIMAMIKGQIQSEVIDNVKEELKKSKGNTISRIFVFDRDTDIGRIQLGDRFLAYVASDDLRPPEGQECEKRLLKKFGKPNGLPAR